MLKPHPLTLFGYLLIVLLTIQSVTVSNDSHSELDVAAQHLPPHHQDAADGSPHLDQSGSHVHPASRSHPHPDDAGRIDEGLGVMVVIDQLTPGEHDQPDIAQDCNHCCHCHGSASLCLPSANLAIIHLTGKHWTAAADSGFPHGYISALFRPPIA